ncbi:hypothetical protein [Halorubrum hochstenium]|uniref:hypothetical protein n=1 Tax=Halorubrum hochstenium TaxID=1227480 RepID=UPI001267682C|nr:hypothetical protein [Halorubrum hochstenium]
MTAQYGYSYHGFEISIETEPEPSPVLWTHQTPTLKITFENTQESTTEWSEDNSIRVAIEVDGDQVWTDIVGFGPLDHGKSKTIRIEGAPLTFEGHAVVGVISGGVSNPNSDDRRAGMNPGSASQTISPCYAFSVWDESHYDATVRTPKRLQWASVVTSAALIFFALVQIWITL